MNRFGIDDIQQKNFSIIVNEKLDSIKLILSGEIDMENPSILLEPFFDKIHNTVLKNNIKNVNVQIKDLLFINSSTIKCLIKWIIQVPRLRNDQKYKINFFINKNSLWQYQSFDSFSFFAEDIITITKV